MSYRLVREHEAHRSLPMASNELRQEEPLCRNCASLQTPTILNVKIVAAITFFDQTKIVILTSAKQRRMVSNKCILDPTEVCDLETVKNEPNIIPT